MYTTQQVYRYRNEYNKFIGTGMGTNRCIGTELGTWGRTAPRPGVMIMSISHAASAS